MNNSIQFRPKIFNLPTWSWRRDKREERIRWGGSRQSPASGRIAIGDQSFRREKAVTGPSSFYMHRVHVSPRSRQKFSSPPWTMATASAPCKQCVPGARGPGLRSILRAESLLGVESTVEFKAKHVPSGQETLSHLLLLWNANDSGGQHVRLNCERVNAVGHSILPWVRNHRRNHPRTCTLYRNGPVLVNF